MFVCTKYICVFVRSTCILCVFTRVCVYLLHAWPRPLSVSRSLFPTVKRVPASAGVLAADDVHMGSLPPVRGTKASGEGKES